MSDTSSLSERIAESLVLQDPSTSPTSSNLPNREGADTNTTSVPQPLSQSPALDKLRSLLRQTLRIQIVDGRIFLGTFAGTDRLLNVLLINTDEFKLTTPNPNPDGRFVGLVLIPWRLVVRVEAHRPKGRAEVDPDPGVGLRGIVDRMGYDDAYQYTDDLYS